MVNLVVGGFYPVLESGFLGTGVGRWRVEIVDCG